MQQTTTYCFLCGVSLDSVSWVNFSQKICGDCCVETINERIKNMPTHDNTLWNENMSIDQVQRVLKRKYPKERIINIEKYNDMAWRAEVHTGNYIFGVTIDMRRKLIEEDRGGRMLL